MKKITFIFWLFFSKISSQTFQSLESEIKTFVVLKKLHLILIEEIPISNRIKIMLLLNAIIM